MPKKALSPSEPTIEDLPDDFFEVLANIDDLELELKRKTLTDDYKEFAKFVFKEILNKPFLDNWHIDSFAKIARKIVDGEMQYVVINIPPRYGKTLFMTIIFSAWTLAINSSSRYIHLSNSKNLVLDNSSDVKNIVTHPAYQELWPVVLKEDSKSKEKWYTTDDGGMYAIPSKGQVIGFGAGQMGTEDFAGAIIIDDPIKAGDVSSDIIRNSINENFNKSIITRVNNKRTTPIILIMQRLHEDDLAGFILEGYTEIPVDEVHHINIPAINEDGPSEYDPRDVGEVLWEEKHTLEHLKQKEEKTPQEYYGQYQQRPAPASGILFDVENISFYDNMPDDVTDVQIAWDTAFKDKEMNDYTVGTVWGIVKTRYQEEFYLLDIVRRRLKYPDLKKTLKAFSCKSYGGLTASVNLIEDKASGQSLIQDLQQENFKRVRPINIKGSKIERAQASTDMFLQGRVHIPRNASFTQAFVNELMMFPNGKHDDQVDSVTLFLNTRLTIMANIRLIKLG